MQPEKLSSNFFNGDFIDLTFFFFQRRDRQCKFLLWCNQCAPNTVVVNRRGWDEMDCTARQTACALIFYSLFARLVHDERDTSNNPVYTQLSDS